MDQSTEETVLMVLDLPCGKDWAWLADCNILAISSRLCAAERERAIDQAQAHWRRSLLKVVEGGKSNGRVTA